MPGKSRSAKKSSNSLANAPGSLKKLELELTAISEAFEIAKEQGLRSITVKLPVPLNRVEIDRRQLTLMEVLQTEPQTHTLVLNDVMNEVHAAQILDKLRMRGTPIDMIDSYLLAGDVDAAGIALRSVVLENIYEHLQLHKHLRVQFSTKQNPHVHVPEGTLINVAEFKTGHCVQKMAYDLSDQNVQPPVYQIANTQDTRDVGDALRATLLQQVANTTATLLEQIRVAINDCDAIPTCIRLYPSWSVGGLKVIPDNTLPILAVGSHVTIGVAAYNLKKK